MLRNLVSLALIGSAQLCQSSYVSSMPPHAQQLLNESMGWMDDYYDSSYGYLYNLDGGSALRHNTRSSSWYAVGLLARNEGSDAADAEHIITNIIKAQFKNESEQWYGDYQKYPEEAYVGTAIYPASIYNSWDPNWRGFVGTTFVLIIEEFGHLLTSGTQDLMLESLNNATTGDTYRVGGVDGDNLYPAYSNPSIMRAFVSGWVGRRLNDDNHTRSGEAYAKDIVDLFNMADTLSEFNSGTYTGVSLFGLILWSKYLPADSIMGENGPRMLQETWNAVSQLWHPGMKNMAGPWDRSYGYDMNRYVSLMAIWLWTIMGKESSSLISKPYVMSHSADYAWAPLMAVLAEYHNSLLPEGLIEKLQTFGEERTFTAQAYYPPLDLVPRNITSWLSENMTIGAESYDEIVVGGPSISQEAFNPAVIQWTTGAEIGFISLWPTEKALGVEVAPGKLELSYPHGNSSSIFTLVVSTFAKKNIVSKWEDVQGMNVTVTGNANATYKVTYAGQGGGASKPLRDFEWWNFTYTMPKDFVGVPKLSLDLKLW